VLRRIAETVDTLDLLFPLFAEKKDDFTKIKGTGDYAYREHLPQQCAAARICILHWILPNPGQPCASETQIYPTVFYWRLVAIIPQE